MSELCETCLSEMRPACYCKTVGEEELKRLDSKLARFVRLYQLGVPPKEAAWLVRVMGSAGDA